jgi:hypothetical protein
MDLSAMQHRQRIVNGLIELASFLACHPDVPVPDSAEVTLCVLDDDDEKGLATVRAAAEALNRPVNGGAGHPQTARSFGPIQYRVFYVCSDTMRRHRAAMSYADSVEAA